MSIKQRHKHIELAKGWVEVYHADKFKTAIPDPNPIFYNIVTRVNYLTSCLWLEYMKQRWNTKQKGVALPDKPNWLVMTRKFKRAHDLNRKDD